MSYGDQVGYNEWDNQLKAQIGSEPYGDGHPAGRVNSHQLKDPLVIV